MDITLLVGKALGIYLVVSGLVLFFKGKTLTIILKDFFNHPAIIFLTGMILLFLSSMYLLQYNVWNWTTQTIITIFVWLIGIKGLMYIFFPETLNDWVVKKVKGFYLYGAVAILVGIYLFFLN